PHRELLHLLCPLPPLLLYLSIITHVPTRSTPFPYTTLFRSHAGSTPCFRWAPAAARPRCRSLVRRVRPRRRSPTPVPGGGWPRWWRRRVCPGRSGRARIGV